jgi:U3 small nucleolar ribonucleoprotein protein LCP5
MAMNRLNEMKVVLDKMRGLDKKLRYQIDKLLAANASASVFASAGDNKYAPEDPLQFRPDPEGLDDDNLQSSENSDDEANNYGSNSDDGGDKDDEEDDDKMASVEDDDDDDMDLQAARKTLSLSKSKKSENAKEVEDDGIYRAPRSTAVPYSFDQEHKEKEKEKRARRRMRATELAQTLRAQYGDAPEQDDIHGGSDFGKQRAAARRLAELEAEKTKYEEDVMVRLQTSRKDKKEKRRLMRQEGSNLSAIADLSNLVRETKAIGRFGDQNDDEDERATKLRKVAAPKRYDNGKRRREQENGESTFSGRRSKFGTAKNSLQAALYNTSGKSNKKKGKR